jgi:hypothetical protein
MAFAELGLILMNFRTAAHEACINELELIKKRYSSLVTGPEWPRGFQEVKVPIFHDNGTGWW